MSPSPALLPVDVAVDEEKVPSYRPEHYYPANPGDLLAARYRLLVKVSPCCFVHPAGPYALGNCLRPKRYVAVKLCNYDTSDEEMTNELDMSIIYPPQTLDIRAVLL
ncbi:protein kinase-like protein [Metarhizium acridum CQMa 102]|uniref:Protein kinase-like protein n=1 Tax=Metarhizium acridum (strain CQMa 102) TaxID=655827 RepID=E9EF50_METAQ|nr:protein kinase-like protein [Metarhizium acridum CQMa 102]EFY85433.1 protein kinase-like protein [Metarhizium acridum CQMa 102]